MTGATGSPAASEIADPRGTPELRICALPGDGIGPAVTRGALRVLEAVADAYGHELAIEEAAVGWTAVQETGRPLPRETLLRCRASDAVLLGAVGDPAAGDLPPDRRPEAGLLALRRALGCRANLRPARAIPALLHRSPLREERVRGTDLLIVRELSGGLYYGEPRWSPGEEVAGERREDAGDTMRYGEGAIRRVARLAFELAAARGGSVTSVDKANVLETSILWRRTVREVADSFPTVPCRHVLVDRAAMELVLDPSRFDVILTSNLFGDILSDQVAGVVGSIGLLGSASLGDGPGLFEPVHGSAPDLEPRSANPAGAIASAALLLRHSAGLEREARELLRALDHVLTSGPRPAELAEPGGRVATTAEFSAAVAERVRRGPETRSGEEKGGER